jgi:hypothetical protein
VNIDELLSIDIDAEIRKLSGSQLASAEESLTAALRCLLGNGATRIEISREKSTVRFDAPGWMLPPKLRETIAAILDPSLPSTQRHEALVAFEAEHDLGWLALLSLSGASLDPLTIPRLGARAAEDTLLRRVCRFASAKITLDGEPISHGIALPDHLAVRDVQNGVIGLPREGELVHLVELRHQLVEREHFQKARDGRVFSVVFERGADMRSLGFAVDALYRWLAASFPALGPRDRAVARELLFRACEEQRSTAPIDGARIFLRSDGGFADLSQMPVRDGVLIACDPRDRFPEDPVFVLVAREREMLRKVLGVTCLPPQIAYAPTRLARLQAAATAMFRRGVLSLRDTLSPSRPVDERTLTTDETRFVLAVRQQLASGAFSFSGSRGLSVVPVSRGRFPCRVAKQTVMLPLRTKRARKMIAALAEDPRLLYPLMSVIFGGLDGWGNRKRRLAQPFFTASVISGSTLNKSATSP